MGIRDQRIDWIRKRLWITGYGMQGIGLNAETDASLQAFETTGVTLEELTNIGIGSLIMTDGEFLNGAIVCPYDLDPGWPIGFRVCYTLDHDGAGAATVDWILLVDSIKSGAAIAVPSTALDTVIAQDSYVGTDGTTSTTDWLLQFTARGIKDSIGLTRVDIEAGAFIAFKLEMDAAVNETSVRFLGLEMDYVPFKTQGEGSHIDKPLQHDGVK